MIKTIAYPPKSLYYSLITLLLLPLIFQACRRQELLSKTMPLNQEKARAWLHKNGMGYKNEKISVTIAAGKTLTGRLNWEKAIQYPWQGQDYLDIPFEFNGRPLIPANDGMAPAAFNLVIRKKGNSFEGALRNIMYASSQSTSGTVSNKLVQQYQLLDGQPANIWLSNTRGEPPVAAKREDISAAAFAAIMLQPAQKTSRASAKTEDRLMTALQTCKWDHIVTYSGNCNYAVGDEVFVALCRHDYYIKTCDIIDLGDSGGGTTGSTTTYPPAPTPESPTEPEPDPCAEAKKKADSIARALNDPKIKEHLEKFITDYKNSTIEHGFAIIKNTDGSYDFTTTLSGSNNHIEWSLPANLNIVALVHVHPPGASAIPSPTDIFGLNNYTNPSFAGSIVISGDDRYMVSVTNAGKYAGFVAKKNEYYDVSTESQWKKKSVLFDNYYDFIENAKGIYTQGTDLAFPAQLYLMKAFNKGKGMGVSLQKWNGTAFSPISTSTAPNTSTGSSSTIGGGGQTINSKYTSITVGPACN